MLAVRVGLTSDPDLERAMSLSDEVGKMLRSLIEAIQRRRAGC